jgi:CopG family nickel-responsive transcriptional regulator
VNRSEAIRDLVRDKLVELEWENDQKDVVGTVTFVYDHHTPKISDKLVEIQHANHSRIKSSMHVHLDHHHCLEVLVVTGSKSEIHKLADEILSARGVLHGKLTTTTTGKEIR